MTTRKVARDFGPRFVRVTTTHPQAEAELAEAETCTGCGKPIATPSTLPEALRTAGKRQCEACDLFDRL